MDVEKIQDVFPGDEVCSTDSTTSLGIHGGRATVAGLLCRVSKHMFVLSKTNRYQPCIDDIVIGRVVHTSQDVYRVDLGGTVAVLPSLAFKNATKRNRPEIHKNDYVLCRISRNGVEPLLSCVEEGFGKLCGAVFPLDPWKARMLYLSPVLAEVGRQYRFKAAVGLNGMVWIDTERITDARDICLRLNTALQ